MRRNDIYNKSHLEQLGLNKRQVKGVLFVKEKGEINNSEYQKINNISKRTATDDLTELVEKYELLERKGKSGAGISYKVMGQ